MKAKIDGQIEMDLFDEKQSTNDKCATKNFISHYEIFDYWKDKAITDCGDVIIEIGYGSDEYNKNFDVSKSVAAIEDWGEPRCFACGKLANSCNFFDDDVTNEDFDFKKLWNQKAVVHSFQKCHIVPRALGGETIAENMFLLCPDCHKESPDTIFKKEFLKWIYKRKKEPPKIFKALKNAVEQLSEQGIPFMPNAPLKIGNDINSHGGDNC